MRKTKIICTIGPSSQSEDVLRKMIIAGMDVARVNFSHGEYESHKVTSDLVKKVRGELGKHTAIMLDTKGPEIRIGKFKNGRVMLRAGQNFSLCLYETEGDEGRVSVNYTNLYRDIQAGTKVLIDDGLIEMRVLTLDDREIVCDVINGGEISDNKGVNVPSVKLSLPFLSVKDKRDIAFAAKEAYDFIAASFTQSAADIRQIRAELDKCGCKTIRIIAKIENAIGVANIDEIISESDGIMIARGDMGVEIPMENIPIIQKQLITKCFGAGKQVITATQMLESMRYNPRPTRAEVTDVANAIYDGTSAIMLSGETAAGMHPIEAVQTMARIATRTEADVNYRDRFYQVQINEYANVTNAISHASCTTAHDLKAAAIITVTKLGKTARMLSRFRPEMPIIACSPEPESCRHMNMSWGVFPILIPEMTGTDELLSTAVNAAQESGCVQPGDLVVITAGIPLGVSGTTNMLKVQEIEL